MRGKRPVLFRWVVLVAMALTVGTVTYSFAQETAPTGEYKEGLSVGGWRILPSVFVGGVYDSNTDQSATGTDRNSGVGLRVTPHLVGTHDDGIHKTTVYGVVDAEFFNADAVAATLGFSHNYEAMRDLTFNFQGNYTR